MKKKTSKFQATSDKLTSNAKTTRKTEVFNDNVKTVNPKPSTGKSEESYFSSKDSFNPHDNNSYKQTTRQTTRQDSDHNSTSSLSVLHTVIISCIASMLALLIFITIVVVNDSQFKTTIKRLRNEIENKNQYYSVQLEEKMNSVKVVDELETLKSLLASKTNKMKNKIHGFNLFDGLGMTDGLVDDKNKIGVNCMLQPNIGQHTRDGDFCCLYLAQSNMEKIDKKKLEYCMALLLSTRFNINNEESEEEHQPVETLERNNTHPYKKRRICHVQKMPTYMKHLCCMKSSCRQWSRPSVRRQCRACNWYCPECTDDVTGFFNL